MARPQFDVSVNGMGLEDSGYSDGNTIDPASLLTFGLIWGCGNHWGPAPCSNVTLTTWSTYAGFTITTVWTNYTPNGVEDCD